jgi:thiol-disulfide isomerase/thioredoxin
MKRFAIFALSLAAVAFLALSVSAKANDAGNSKETAKAEKADAKPAKTPDDRVVVMYFHRTQRCPTCRRMGSYTQESVQEKYADALKKGTVEFRYVDFQDKKNEAQTKGYKVTGPTLIVAKIEKNKVKDFKNLKEIWDKNNDKQAFYKYVQENIDEYAKSLDEEKKDQSPSSDKGP